MGVKKRPTIPRLDGGPQTILLVEDVERAAAFYTQELRLERREGDTARYAELDTGDGGVLLLVKRDGSIAPMVKEAAEKARATLTFEIPAEGYDLWKKWFVDRDVLIAQETRWVHGGRSLYVHDPDGWRVEFKTPAVLPPPPPVVPKPRVAED